MRKARNPRKIGVTKLSPNTSVDNKLTHASILLSYLFEHGVDFQRRIINVTGEIHENTFNLIDAALTEMEAESKATITIKINSPGGDVYQAMAIAGRIKESKCPIVTKGYGCIMSAACLLLAAGNKRKVSKYSWFMSHESSYHIDHARHSQAKALVKQAEREEEYWATLMAELTKKPKSYWLKTGVGTDAYFSPNELIESGVVDEVF